MARRPDEREAEMLSANSVVTLRTLARQSVRDFYEQACRDCRLIANRLPTPKQIQTLVQVWKQEVAVNDRYIQAKAPTGTPFRNLICALCGV